LLIPAVRRVPRLRGNLFILTNTVSKEKILLVDEQITTVKGSAFYFTARGPCYWLLVELFMLLTWSHFDLFIFIWAARS
jgi:hypothetical protein